jgi:hypothetical protein
MRFPPFQLLAHARHRRRALVQGVVHPRRISRQKGARAGRPPRLPANNQVRAATRRSASDAPAPGRERWQGAPSPGGQPHTPIFMVPSSDLINQFRCRTPVRTRARASSGKPLSAQRRVAATLRRTPPRCRTKSFCRTCKGASRAPSVLPNKSGPDLGPIGEIEQAPQGQGTCGCSARNR